MGGKRRVPTSSGDMPGSSSLGGVVGLVAGLLATLLFVLLLVAALQFLG